MVLGFCPLPCGSLALPPSPEQDVQLAVGPELQRPGVVVVVGLLDLQQLPHRPGIGAVGVPRVDPVLHHPVGPVLDVRVVDEQAAVLQVLRVEGQPQQPLLAVGPRPQGHLAGDVQERRRQQRLALQDPDRARLLDDEQPAAGGLARHRIQAQGFSGLIGDQFQLELGRQRLRRRGRWRRRGQVVLAPHHRQRRTASRRQDQGGQRRENEPARTDQARVLHPGVIRRSAPARKRDVPECRRQRFTPTAHQNGGRSEKRMSRRPAAVIIASIWPAVNRCSSGVPKRSRASVRIV